MGDTLKPSIDPGLYIMTWQNPADDAPGFELINGFGGLEWCVVGAMNLRWIHETIAQNRIIRVREQYSMWDGHSRMGPDFEDAPNEKILTRTCDGKIILELPNRNKPVCTRCKVNVLSFGKVCTKCQGELDKIYIRQPKKQTYKEFLKEWLN